jgi:hypothetical protein
MAREEKRGTWKERQNASNTRAVDARDARLQSSMKRGWNQEHPQHGGAWRSQVIQPPAKPKPVTG